MAGVQTYFKTFSITAANNGEVDTQALITKSGVKTMLKRIYADSVANVSIVVYAGQLKVFDIISKHFPSDGSGFELPIDVDAASEVDLGIVNNTGAAQTINITLEYTQG